MHKEIKLSQTDNTSSTSCEKLLNNNISFVSSTSSSSSSSSSSAISLTQQQEQRLRSFTEWYPQETPLQQLQEYSEKEESYEYDAGKSMSEISASTSLSSSKLRHLSHSPPIKSHSMYSSNISPPSRPSTSLKQSENEREMENTEDLQRGAEKYWSGLYSGATDLFSLAMLSSMEEEHNIRELRLRFEQCVEQIHCSINYIRRNGLHEALLLLHTAQTQSALESALLASSCAKAKNKCKYKNNKRFQQNSLGTNLGRSKSTEITNIDYHEEQEEEEEYGMSAMRSNRRTRMTSTPTLQQLPPSQTTAIAGNETEEMIIRPFDGMRTNVLNNNDNVDDDNDLALQSETWRLLQNALRKVDVISVLFEKILQLRIDLRTRMSMAALSATPSVPVVTPVATPTTSNESQSAFSYAGFSANPATIQNNNNYSKYKYNNDIGSSIKLTEDEALLWSSVTHVDPLRVLEQAQLENEEIFSSSSSSEEELNEEKFNKAEKHIKYNTKESKQTIEHKEMHNMDATSPIVELKGNKELVSMFRNMKEMADLNHKDIKYETSLSPHKEIISVNIQSEAKEEQNKGIATPQQQQQSNADNKNNVITNTTTESKSNKMKDKFHNMVHYPPRLPHANLQQCLTRVTFVEQLYALRLLQGFSLANAHQRYLIGHSCFLWYATELYECFVQHVEAIARINRLQAQQRELRRECKEKIWVELQQCKRELAYNRRRHQQHNKEYYYANDLSLTSTFAASLSSSSSSSFAETTQQPHNEIEEEEEPLHLRSCSSLSSSSSCVLEECNTKKEEEEEEEQWRASHPFHTQNTSLPASLIRRQRWRTQAQQNVHPTMRSLQFNKDNNYVANMSIKRSSYYYTNSKYNNRVLTSQSSREAQRNMNVDLDGNNYDNSAHWVSHTRSQSFNVEPIHIRSFSLQSIYGRDKIERRPQNYYYHYRGDWKKELEAVNVLEKKIKHLEEELREIKEEEEKREEEGDEEIEERRHFAVRADQVEVMMALTDALEALCHYNSYALNKLIHSNTLEAMLNVAFCPMVHEPLRLTIFNTVSVLLQELATFRQASQLLISAPESNFSRTLQKEPHSILESQKAKETQNNFINENSCSENDVEVNYIGSNDNNVLQAMLENANMIDVRNDSNINETRTRENMNIDSSNTRNNNNKSNNKFQNKATTSPYHHKFRNEQSCGFTFDINVANKFETAVKEWLITHGLMHLFASLCELHTLREWELLQDVTSFSYTGSNTTTSKKNRAHGNITNISKKAEMNQAELQRQMQRSRHLREHQQRAFLQAVDGKRAEMKEAAK